MAAPRKFHVKPNCTKEDFDQLVKEMYDVAAKHEDMIALYQQWAPHYEQNMTHSDYHGPQQSAAKMAELFPSNRENVKVLDVCAGTGLTGVELQKVGFKKLDALDGSQNMLEEAKKKGVYGQYICAYLGEKPTPIPDNTYDVVHQCGAGHLGHVPGTAFREFVRIVKPGGYVSFLYFAPDVGKDELYDVELHVKKLDQEGLIEDLQFSPVLGRYWISEGGKIVTFKKK
jgi:ubiquinone/menaquinone biosynthesis C-methylase UbiE